MSKRTAESNKAIAAAWEKEQQYVNEGKGTRDWTIEQQQDILNRGKAYDEHGKAFQGQHMRSVEEHPECQGNPDNIQFLTREEHLAAHDGDWRNPTNWYYDPATKQKHDFGKGPIIPCKVFELSHPIKKPVESTRAQNDTSSREEAKNGEQRQSLCDNTSLKDKTCPKSLMSNIDATKSLKPHPNNWFSIMGEKFTDFYHRHKKEILGMGGLLIGYAYHIFNSKSDDNSHFTDDYTGAPLETDNMPGVDRVLEDTYFEGNNLPEELSYPDTHASPKEHTVPKHGQHYHTKEGLIWKEKESYQRGGNKDS